MTPANLAEIVQALLILWRRDTEFSSKPETDHLAYRLIIAIGAPAVPFLVREMDGHLSPALRSITGHNPVPPEHAGDIDAIAADWLAWAKERRWPGV